jgi:lipid II isoglutaminyl synthase (glutamine-hydrolysing)
MSVARRVSRPRGRLAVALGAARTAGALSRALRHGSGMVIGGRVLLAIDPDAAAELSEGRRITLVSGTNGKSTTTALIAAALGGVGSVDTNPDGANTGPAVAGALARSRLAQSVLEVDEAWLPWASRQTSPAVVVLTNLSRDQLSRHHEVGSIAAAWRKGLGDVPLVVANADDPAVVWAAMAAGRQEWVAAGANRVDDSSVCPACAALIKWSAEDWSCSACDLRRPEPHWWLEGDVLRSRETAVRLSLALPGRFNVANAALATVAAHLAAGLPVRDAADRLAGVPSVAGRFDRVPFRGHDVSLLLAKNPAGWLEILDLVAEDRHPMVLLLNAEDADGHDPSWIYDVPFSRLAGRTVVVQGRRATDLLVRLELDGVRGVGVRGSLADGLRHLPPGRVDVVGNYSAFRTVVGEVRRG